MVAAAKVATTIRAARRIDIQSLTAPAIIALAAVLRLALISGFRFHPDEALYATWARLVATGQDVWLATRVVDKPPLFIYTLAALFGTLGASEEIARVPNEIASIVSVALTYVIACEVYDRRVALLAALALALSPLAILFAPTAFTDPLMLMWLLASAWLALRRRAALSGLALGLALATKQDAMLAAPLLVMICVSKVGEAKTRSSTLRTVIAWAAGFAPPAALVWLWSALRPAPDFLSASLAHYGSTTLVPIDEYVARAVGFAALTSNSSAPWLLMLALAVAPLLLWRERRRADQLMVGSIGYWFALHVVVSFPIWDRYALPLAPLLAIFVARAWLWCIDRIPARALQRVAISAAIALLVQPAFAALHNEIPVGRDSGALAGVDQVGQFFWEADTTATILYDRDLSWEIDYYTFGRILDRRWMPDLRALADDAAHMPLARRYVALAAWEATPADIDHALERVGLKADVAFTARNSTGSPAIYVYLLTPRVTREGGHAASGSSEVLSLY